MSFVAVVKYPREGQCKAQVWKRDTYRRTGRGKTGWSMHYDKCQCARAATGDGFCWQHSALATTGSGGRTSKAATEVLPDQGAAR